MLKFFVIFAVVLAVASALPFNLVALFGGQSSPIVEEADTKSLRYPKNSFMDAFFENLQPDPGMKEELDNLKYPDSSWIAQTTSDALTFITNVQQRVSGIVQQVQSDPNLQNIGKAVEGILRLALGNKFGGGSSNSTSSSVENDPVDDFYKEFDDDNSSEEATDSSSSLSSSPASTSTEEVINSTTIANDNDDAVATATTPDESVNEI